MTGALLSLDDPKRIEAMAACQAITRTRARNFYYGMRLTPEPKRSALYAMYAWMRVADDLADATGVVDRRSALDAFMEKTDLAMAGDLDALESEPLWRALADTVARFDLDRDCLDEMLAGQFLDLRPVRVRRFGELESYCRRVASTVGRTCIRIWGIVDDAAWDEAYELAEQRGIAFQLTNILRDVCEDFDLGRVYIPREDLDAHGLTTEALLTWESPAKCRALIRQQVERARSYYAKSQPLDQLVQPDCAAALWTMTRVYQTLLNKIGRRPQAAVEIGPVALSDARKVAIALRAVAQTRWQHRRSKAGKP
ncbi:MAG: phytoene/squalene synthase family protein [Phycisphaerales bacterium]|nr:phytoene/squalene synthase family protein [Phycisphaerales bacterium]